MSRTRRRPRKGPRYLFSLVILTLLVFLGADNFGFDWFNDFQLGLSNSSSTTDSTTSNIDNAKKTSMSGYVNIVIKDDQITYNESLISMDDLATALDQLEKNDITINLMDNVAFNTTFSDVETLLKNKDMKYTVSTIKSGN